MITFDEGSDSAATAARHPVSALTTRTCRCPAGTGWRAASLWRQLDLPQIRLESLLKARAEEFSPRRIRFGHELIAWSRTARAFGPRSATTLPAAGTRCAASTCAARTGTARDPDVLIRWIFTPQAASWQ
jgi:hypothetical protein